MYLDSIHESISSLSTGCKSACLGKLSSSTADILYLIRTLDSPNVNFKEVICSIQPIQGRNAGIIILLGPVQ